MVQPTYFMKIFGVSSEAITARAVATNVSGGDGGGCLYTLGPPSSSIEGVNINGSATFNAPSCGIEDNGNFNTKGNALTVNSGTFGVSGDWDKSGPGGTVTCGPTQPTCPATNVPAATDPMLNRTTDSLPRVTHAREAQGPQPRGRRKTATVQELIVPSQSTRTPLICLARVFT